MVPIAAALEAKGVEVAVAVTPPDKVLLLLRLLLALVLVLVLRVVVAVVVSIAAALEAKGVEVAAAVVTVVPLHTMLLVKPTWTVSRLNSISWLRMKPSPRMLCVPLYTCAR